MYFFFHKPEISVYSKWHMVNGVTGLFASIILLNGYRYTTITDSKKEIKNWVEISFSDSTKIKKGKTNIFIGKTNNFYFIYNRKEKNTDIYIRLQRLIKLLNKLFLPKMYSATPVKIE